MTSHPPPLPRQRPTFDGGDRLRPLDFVLCLVGNARAIRKCRSSRDTIAFGGVVALNAGLAIGSAHGTRLSFVWLVALPFVASWAIALIADNLNRRSQSTDSRFRELFKLILLSFAIQVGGSLPFDLVLPRPSVQYAYVFGWRIATIIQLVLITRFVSVVHQESFVRTAMRLIPIASLVVIAVELFPPQRNGRVLGELLVIRLNGTDSLAWIFDTVTLTWSVFGLCASTLYFLVQRPSGIRPISDSTSVRRERSLTKGTITGLLVVSNVFWIIVIAISLPKQILSAKVDRRMWSGDIQGGLSVMNDREERAFPTAWEPLPKLTHRPLRPDICDMIEEVARMECKPWVRERFLLKFRSYIGHRNRFNPEFYFRDSVRSFDLARVTSLLERLPEGPEIASEHVSTMEVLLDGWRKNLTPEELALFARWSKLAEKRPPADSKAIAPKDRSFK